MRTRPDGRLAATASRQWGLVTREQALAAGLSADAISWRLRTQRWHLVHATVYAIAGSPNSFEQRLLAACLWGGPGTLAACGSAARLWGLPGTHSTAIHVVSPRARRLRAANVRTHRTDSLSAVDAAVRHGIPVTSACRTIIDCAAASPPRRLGEMLDDARRRRLVRLGEVARRVDELATSGRHGITAMREALADRGAPPASVFESRVARLLHGAQLPRAERNWRVDLDGETYFLDFAFPDRKVCIEADSEAFHLDLASFRRDRQRQNVLVLHGWTVIRFTWADVRDRPERVVEQVRRALHQAEARVPGSFGRT